VREKLAGGSIVGAASAAMLLWHVEKHRD